MASLTFQDTPVVKDKCEDEQESTEQKTNELDHPATDEIPEPKPQWNFLVNDERERPIKPAILEVIHSATSKLEMSIYAWMDEDFVQSIIQCVQRDVAVRLSWDDAWYQDCVTRQEKYYPDFVSPLKALYKLQKDFPTKVVLNPVQLPANKYGNHPPFHHKVLLTDTQLVLGSYNWTGSANTKNGESILVVDHVPQDLKDQIVDFFGHLFE